MPSAPTMLVLPPAAGDLRITLTDNLPLECPTPDEARRLGFSIDATDKAARRWAITVLGWADAVDAWWDAALAEIDAEQIRAARAHGWPHIAIAERAEADALAESVSVQVAGWYEPGPGPAWLDVVTAGVDTARTSFPPLPLGLVNAWRFPSGQSCARRSPA